MFYYILLKLFIAQSYSLCQNDPRDRITNSHLSPSYFLIRYRNYKNYDNKTDAAQEQTKKICPFFQGWNLSLLTT